MRLQLSESFRLDVERGTHRTIVNLLRTTDDECSPVLFSLNGSDVEVTVLLQVYRENRLLLVIDFDEVCAPDEALLNDIGFSIGVCLQQDLAAGLPSMLRLKHYAPQVHVLLLRFA